MLGFIRSPGRSRSAARVRSSWSSSTLESVAAAAAADPAKVLSRTRRQSVKPFARYEGTSVWKRNRGGSGRAEFAKALAARR